MNAHLVNSAAFLHGTMNKRTHHRQDAHAHSTGKAKTTTNHKIGNRAHVYRSTYSLLLNESLKPLLMMFCSCITPFVCILVQPSSSEIMRGPPVVGGGDAGVGEMEMATLIESARDPQISDFTEKLAL